MILLLFAFVALVVALARGGKIAKLSTVHFRAGWLAILAVAVQILIFSGAWSGSALDAWTPALYTLSMVFLIAAVGINWRVPGLSLLGLGLLSNTLAIALNGGRMPASAEALRLAGLEEVALKAGALGSSTNSILIGPGTKLPYLCDILPLPSWLPLANVISAGDVLIALGAAWFFLGVVTPGSESAADDE